MKSFKEQALTCIYDQPAFCSDVCPFSLDVRDLIAKVKRGGFDAAFRSYRTAVLFPGIVANICPAYCGGHCIRKDVDDAVDLHAIEKAILDNARRTDPVQYNLPAKTEHVAIIGGGISGLAAALRLCNKKYNVTVFEKSGSIGGHLSEIVPSKLLFSDIEKQFKFESYELKLSNEIVSLGSFDYDAYYVATGSGGDRFGYKENKDGVFLGGGLLGHDAMHAIADGIEASNLIEGYLKTKLTEQPKPRTATTLIVDRSLLKKTPKRPPSDPDGLSKEEAAAEANRCIECNCTACRRHNDIMRYFKKLPKPLNDEVTGTLYPASIFSTRMATRLLGCENIFALGREICPMGIDFETFLCDSHRVMVGQGNMPEVFSAYWLDDMRHADGEKAALTKKPTESAAQYAFFPGCQMGASSPLHVEKIYEKILTFQPDTALLLRCCGASALWGGDEERFNDSVRSIREKWHSLGKPKMIFACPSCEKIFLEYLPEIDRINLYSFLLEQGVEPPCAADGEIVSVFDPCSSRGNHALQQAVRKLAEKAGYTLQPLPYEGDMATCCGFGGQAQIANPLFTEDIVKHRVALGDHPYITYCANCNDSFRSHGKEARHILDILLGIHAEPGCSPTPTERRHNRTRLKNALLRRYWKEESVIPQEKPTVKIVISDEVRKKLSDMWTIEEDIAAAIEYCEESGNRILDGESGNLRGHLQIGYMTYWVEYRPLDDGFQLINAYSHRMQIKEAAER